MFARAVGSRGIGSRHGLFRDKANGGERPLPFALQIREQLFDLASSANATGMDAAPCVRFNLIEIP